MKDRLNDESKQAMNEERGLCRCLAPGVAVVNMLNK